MSDQIQYINKCDLLREIEAQIRVEDSFMHQVETGRIMYFSGRKAALKDLQEEIAKGKLVVAPYPLRREKPPMTEAEKVQLSAEIEGRPDVATRSEHSEKLRLLFADLFPVNETGEEMYHRFTRWDRVKQWFWVRYWMLRYGRK